MLIIAIPKSMSTSLWYFLRENHGFSSGKVLPVFQSLPRLKAWAFFHHFTSFCVDCPSKVALGICENKDILWKAHIPPTKNNLKVFSGGKKVILLRDVNEIIASWRRVAFSIKRPVHKLPFDKSFLRKGENKWILQAEKTGLLDELKRFKQGWGSHTKNVLHITYKQLLTNSQKTVNRVEEFFGLPISNNVVMPKMKYYPKVKGSAK